MMPRCRRIGNYENKVATMRTKLSDIRKELLMSATSPMPAVAAK